jgi:4-hydroxy-3-methylbut-2-enyl diphosphate reductase
MIVVVACFRSETRAIKPRADVRIVRTAMGDRAVVDVARALATRPGLLLSSGFCGGLDPALRVGDLVLADEIQSTRATIRIDRGLVERARSALAACGHAPRIGPALCASDVAGPQAKRELAGRGALAVDLESAGLARWAAAHSVPFLSLRVVLDAARDAVPFSRRVPLWVSALGHPLQTLRIARAAGPAAGRLGAAIDCLAEAWEARR